MSFLKKLWSCFFCWQVRLPEWSNEAQAVCACTFGKGDDSCNRALAFHVSEKARRHGLPFCVQGEVGQFVDPHLSGYISANTLRAHGKNYVGTHHTVREHVIDFLRHSKITKIHVEAHAAHAWRVVKCYEKLGIQVVSLCTKGKPYPVRSTQPWC